MTRQIIRLNSMHMQSVQHITVNVTMYVMSDYIYLYLCIQVWYINHYLHQRRLQQSEVCESWPKFGCRYLSYWERRAVALLNMYACNSTAKSIYSIYRTNPIDRSINKEGLHKGLYIYSVIIHYRTIYNHLLFLILYKPLLFKGFIR